MESNNKKEYNKDPVYFCKHCLSLDIRIIQDNEDDCYCHHCGNTVIGITDINHWENLYKIKYHKNHLNNNEDEWRNRK